MSDPYQRDFVAPLQSGHRTRGGAVAARRAQQPAAEVDWDAAIKRLKSLLRRYYRDGGMEGPELEHERIEGTEGTQ